MSHIPSYIQAFVDESDTLSDQVMGNLNEISDNSESDRQKLNQKLKFKHKQTENIVSLNEESRYRQIVQQQSDLILRSLADTTITFANQSLCNTLGVELEQVIGQKWIDFGSPDDLQSILQNIALLSPEKPSFIAVNRDRRGDGQIGWTQWINRGIFNPQGQLVEIQSVGRDITALKLSELALKQLNEELVDSQQQINR
jgi:PAS domain S-box-containing protein